MTDEGDHRPGAGPPTVLDELLPGALHVLEQYGNNHDRPAGVSVEGDDRSRVAVPVWCAEHVVGGEVGLDDLEGYLGQPCVVVAGVAAQPVEDRVHAQVPALGEYPLACSMITDCSAQPATAQRAPHRGG